MQIIVHLSQAAKYICIFASNFQKWIQGATFYAAWASLILFKNQINTLTYECCYDKYIQFFFFFIYAQPLLNNDVHKRHEQFNSQAVENTGFPAMMVSKNNRVWWTFLNTLLLQLLEKLNSEQEIYLLSGKDWKICIKY